jgi:hypothetical protein
MDFSSFVFIFIISCNTKNIPSKSIVDYSTKQMLLSYLKQHKNIDTGASLFIDTLINKSNWAFCSLSKISNDVTLYYLPFNYNRNKTGITFLYDNKSQTVYYSLITEFPKVKNLKKRIINNISYPPVDIISSFYKNNLNGYPGSIRAFSLSNNFLWEFGYKNGRKIIDKRITSRDPNDTASNYDYNNVLIKWHLVTRHGLEYDWKLIGTTRKKDSVDLTIGLSPDSLRIKLNFSAERGYQ